MALSKVLPVSLEQTTDFSINGVTIGKGNSSVSSNTVVGGSSLASVTSGYNNTSVGYNSGNLLAAGRDNVFVGRNAGASEVAGIANTFIGSYAGNVSTGNSNTYIGSGYTGLIYASGEQMTTGNKNVILGNFSGAVSGLDMRTLNNYICLSDGDGNLRQFHDNNGVRYHAGSSSSYGWARSYSGQKTAAASGSAVKLIQIGPCCALSIRIMALQGAESQCATWSGNITVAYGSGGSTAGVSSSTINNITGISVAYDNGGSPIYTINCTLTYSGAAPTIYYQIEGISSYGFTPL